MYLFYVDESGNLDTKGIISSDTITSPGKDWLYVLTAIGIFEHKWRGFYDLIVSRKKQLLQIHHSRDITLDQCKIKSNWLRIPKERQKHPFLSLLTDKEIEELVDIYYDQLDKAYAVLISVVMDKRHLQEYMDASKLHRKAWELLCERIENFMRETHRKHNAVLITDDISKHVNMSLARKHAYFLACGTTANCRLGHIVEMPLFIRSELSEGIQLTDLCS